MRLFICEKPSQARDMANALGKASEQGRSIKLKNGDAITWAQGHLLQLAEPQAYDSKYGERWSFDTLPILPQQLRMVVDSDKKKTVAEIRKLISNSSEIVIATDADREGEAIARELIDVSGFKGPVKRMWFSSQDAATLQKAEANLKEGKETYPLYLAQQGRSRADWLIGMSLTRGYTLLSQVKYGVQGVVSVGRVQSPTLNLIVQRDLEIENFKPKDYYELVGHFTPDAQGPFSAKWLIPDELKDQHGYCVQKDVVEGAQQRVTGQQGEVVLFEDARKKTRAPLPFSLSKLQSACSSKWGMGAKKVLEIAQKLYETYKLTSYPRSDCQYLPTEQKVDIVETLAAIRNTHPDLAAIVDKADPAISSRVWNDGKVGDSAHHAIIPTKVSGSIDRLSADERKVYDLICRHYLAQFYPDYEYDQRRIGIQVVDCIFVVSGNTPALSGWKEVFSKGEAPDENAKSEDDDDDEQALPKLKVGDAVECVRADIKSKKTKPPQHFTEGTLLDAMNNVHNYVGDVDKETKKLLAKVKGLGTEATRAETIEGIKKRGFVELKGKKLISTEKGRHLISILDPDVKDPAMTALWERALDSIAQGKLELSVFEQGIRGQVTDIIERLRPEYLEAYAKSPRAQQDAYPPVDCPGCGAKKSFYRRTRTKDGSLFWGCAHKTCKTFYDDDDGKPVPRS